MTQFDWVLRFVLLSILLTISNLVFGQWNSSQLTDNRNEWTKESSKESFKEKIKRFEESGFQIAVVFSMPDEVKRIHVSDALEEQGRLSLGEDGDTFAFEERALFEDGSEEVVTIFNETFETKVFVKVSDYMVQKKTVYGERVDDFWPSKYKAAVVIKMDPIYSGHVALKEGNYGADIVIADFEMKSSVQFTEYFRKKGNDKTKRLGSVGPKMLYHVSYNENFEYGRPRTLKALDEKVERDRGNALYHAVWPEYLGMISDLISKVDK